MAKILLPLNSNKLSAMEVHNYLFEVIIVYTWM